MPIDEREWAQGKPGDKPRREDYGPNVRWSSPTEQERIYMWRWIFAIGTVLAIIGWLLG